MFAENVGFLLIPVIWFTLFNLSGATDKNWLPIAFVLFPISIVLGMFGGIILSVIFTGSTV